MTDIRIFPCNAGGVGRFPFFQPLESSTPVEKWCEASMAFLDANACLEFWRSKKGSVNLFFQQQKTPARLLSKELQVQDDVLSGAKMSYQTCPT